MEPQYVVLLVLAALIVVVILITLRNKLADDSAERFDEVEPRSTAPSAAPIPPSPDLRAFATRTKEERIALIQELQTPAELEAAWSAWESRGWSRNGQLYAAVLRRKEELGELGTRERRLLIEAEAEKGRSLPPIEGHFGRRS